MLHAVIMAGGSGTRFWPESRRSLPKQFLRLSGDRTLLQQTVDRCQPLIPLERTWIVTNALHVDETRRQLPDLPPAQIITEPCGRNTAPCIGLAAIHVMQHDPAAVMAVMPADHVIQPDSVFQSSLQDAVAQVADAPQSLVLFGAPPTYPATGFGYIERGDIVGPPQTGLFRVQSFREKPDRPTAEQFLRTGRFYWNCGIFVWRADRIRELLAQHQPDIERQLQLLAPSLNAPDWPTTLQQHFPAMPSISIDYAVLEKAADVYVLASRYEWDDVGSWLALSRLHPSDEHHNTILGLHRGIDTQGCIIRSTPDHLIATIGLENCVIVHTPQATLVAKKDDETGLRRLIALLEQHGDARFL